MVASATAPVTYSATVGAVCHSSRVRVSSSIQSHGTSPFGPDGASRRARALEIFDRVPELETWTYGPEAHCDDTVRAELLA